MSNDALAALVNEPNEKFEAFYAEMVQSIPALKGRGAIEVPPASFKRALKIAYLTGADDQLKTLLSSE